MNEKKKAHGYALLPVLLFIGLFLGSGIVLSMQGIEKPFGKYPGSIAAYAGVILCFLLFKGTLNEKVKIFLGGIAKPNVATLCVILTLAGGFSGVTKTIGSVDSIVGLSMTYLPQGLITAGVFVVGCLISFASGTSVGTITAVAPVAISIASVANIPIPVMAGAVLSSAMCGNNMSLISDATIAATLKLGVTDGQGQRDKLIVSLIYACPALILTTIFFAIVGKPVGPIVLEQYSYNLWLLIPYVLVLVLALCGFNVVFSLSAGVISAGILGLIFGSFNFLDMSLSIANGMSSMSTLIIMTFFISGMVAMVDAEGGLAWLTEKMGHFIHGKTSAQIVCFILSILSCCCIGKDAVSIFAVGDILDDICRKYELEPRKMAAIIQSGATATAVFIPYTSVSITMWGFIGSAGFAYGFFEAYPFTMYPLILIAIELISIFIPFENFYLKKHPWKYENEASK